MEAYIVYLIAFITFLGVVFFIWELKLGYSSYNWPTTSGEIVQSKTGISKNKKTEFPYIYYKYTVKGKEYITRRLAMYLTYPTSKEILSKLLKKYPKGKKVEVKYHPIFHGHAVLEPGPRQLREYYVCILVFAIIFISSSVSIFILEYGLFL